MDAKEYSQLFSGLSDRLFRLAKSMLRNNDDAQDAVQNVHLKLWEKREMLNNVENKNTFALKTMRNLCIDNIRQKHYSDELKPEFEYDSPTPIQQTEIKDLTEFAKLLIEKLPEKQRSIIRLRDVEELELDEIAKIMNMTVNAVTVNLSRARTAVKTQLINELN